VLSKFDKFGTNSPGDVKGSVSFKKADAASSVQRSA